MAEGVRLCAGLTVIVGADADPPATAEERAAPGWRSDTVAPFDERQPIHYPSYDQLGLKE